MTDEWVFRRRTLPHVDVDGKPVFITACLKGSFSAVGLRKIRKYREELSQRATPENMTTQEWGLKKHKLTFKLVDSLLDGKSPVVHLKDARLAKVVQDAFLHFADKRYRLYAFVVMPSHHHWVFLPNEEWVSELAGKPAGKKIRKTPREVISHSIQSYTALQCNRILGSSGPFWQTETFDHFARDEPELMRIIHYVEQNPVVAGLAANAEDYRWSSARIRQQLGLEPGEAIPNSVG
ncbi:MAG: transposase [Pirellulaceae bacterium]